MKTKIPLYLSCLLIFWAALSAGCSKSEKPEEPEIPEIPVIKPQESEKEIQDRPVILIFSADVTTIVADGKSGVTFTIMADGENVSAHAEIYRKDDESDFRLEDHTFYPVKAGEYEFYCKFNDLISPSITITVLPLVLTLTADVESIKANGKESVTFTVFAGEDEVTNEALIVCKTDDDEITLENNSFSTTAVGAYEFFAQYLSQASNTVFIEATVSNLTLSSDKTTAKTGETITFEAISDNEHDVSTAILLHITHCDETDTELYSETLEGNQFTPASFGNYSIYASYDEKKSNVIALTVEPSSVVLSVDKESIGFSGVDVATFTVYVDGQKVNNAVVYMIGNPDIKMTDHTFSSEILGDYSFYAQFRDIKSDVKTVRVHFVNFAKQACIMGFVATWCGFSPEMVEVLSQARTTYPNEIQSIIIHRNTSQLASTAIVAEDYLVPNGITMTPYGIMDFSVKIMRSLPNISQNYQNMKRSNPVKAGIAISSQINDNQINVSLKVKVNETNEYRIGAVIVEDGVVCSQLVYPNGDRDDAYWDDHYIHHSVATYIMPGTSLRAGKSLGRLQSGMEVTEQFSIPLNKTISTDRKVNHNHCRVVAYVLMSATNNDYYINNSTSCPINSSISYLYEK